VVFIAFMDAAVHKRFLDYRERHEYFGRKQKVLSYDEFAPLDAEQRELARKTEEERDDEEEARFVELSKILFRD